MFQELVVITFISIIIPLLSILTIWGLILYFNPYARNVFFRNMGLGSTNQGGKGLLIMAVSFSFLLTGGASVCLAVFSEMAVRVLCHRYFSIEVGSAIASWSVGPIEETAKFIVVILVFWRFHLFKFKEGRDPIKDGILIGLFVGCAVGTIESISYIFSGLSILVRDGLTSSEMPRFVGRSILGVSIHGTFTALSCIGLGRSTISKRIAWTVLGFGLATFLHSFNNRISEIDIGNESMVLARLFQIVLVSLGIILIVFIWVRYHRSTGD